MELEVGRLLVMLSGARTALYRRDLPTLVWALERALYTLRELYDEHEKPWPSKDTAQGSFVD